MSTNIYIKQMKKLGLNVKQYAELIDMPIEIVRKFIYGKEGEYEMALRDLLRKDMLNRHQIIEQDKDNAELMALEIKHQDEENTRNWYEKTYTTELLLKKLNLTTKVDFERNYDIVINGKRASKWVYYCLVGKTNYDNHEVSQKVQKQFIEQLYDILVNGNIDKYKRAEPTETKIFPSQRKPIKNKNYKNEYFKWFRDFDIKDYMKNNNLTNETLAKELGLGVCTISHLASKKHYTKRTLEKLYKFVQKTPSKELKEQDYHDKKYYKGEKIYGCEEQKNIEKEMLDNAPIFIAPKEEPKIELIDSKKEIFRKILINRLTEEEKELIELFGGKIC